MSALKLGTHRLPVAETTLIRSLVRQFSDLSSCPWQFADTGPCDVVIVDGVLSDAPQGAGSDAARALLMVVRGQPVTVDDLLRRPICPDQLRGWLERRAQELQPGRTLAVA